MKKKVFLIFLVLIALLTIAGAYIYRNVCIESITVSGNERQDADTIINTIFGDNETKSYLKLWYEYNYEELKEIAWVEEYDIEFKSIKEIVITVYEKKDVGYIQNTGMNWYFDKDGIVTKCTKEKIEGVTFLEGLKVDYVVVGEKMPIKNENAFEVFLQLAQLIQGYNMKIDKVILENNVNFYMVIDKVTIDFGKGDMITEKMHDLNDLLPKMENVKGVLDMREYDTSRKGYNFKKE